ncbi:MAG TPA: glycosyltransferase family 39 protein, partial [Pirellulales bacterium]
LCYHLELPRAFLREGGLAYLPDAHESTFPLLTEMWFLWALALDGPVAAQLVHFALGLLLLLAVREAAAPLGRNWAWLAAGVAALTPVVTNQMTAPLNDVALAAFAALAWAAGERADRESDRRVAWWIVAGIMLGAACAIKFTGLVFAVAWTGGRLVKLWLAASSHAGRHRVIGRECKAASPADRSSNVAPSRNGALVDLTGERRSGWRAVVTHPVGVVAVAAFLVAGLWYGRAAWHTGNPVHPYFSTVFGNPSETSMRASKRPLGRDPLRWLAAPFETTFSPERFGGRAHQFGPLFLAMLPGLLFLAMDRRAWPALTVVAIYSLFWLLLRQNLRFALPMLPVLSIGVVTVWRALPRTGTARGVVLTVALGMLAFTTLVAVRRARHAWPVAVGVESRADYLRRCEPTTGAAEMVSRLTRSHARLLSQETRAFYFDREIVRESLFRSRTAAYDATSSPDEVAARLTRDAFTHLLLAERVTRGSAPYDDVLSRIALPAIERSGVSSDGPFRLLGETTGRDLDGAEYRYRLVEIEPSAAARR